MSIVNRLRERSKRRNYRNKKILIKSKIVKVLREEVLSKIKKINLDLGKLYKNIVNKLTSLAGVVADKFYLMKQVKA